MSDVLEKKSPPWNSTEGIYASYSKGLDKPEFYAKCPNCGHVHGMHRSPTEAVLNRYCVICSTKRIDKLKKEIQKAVRYENRAKLISAVLMEEDEMDDEVRGDIDRNVDNNWLIKAKWDLESEVGKTLEFYDEQHDDYPDTDIIRDTDRDKVYLKPAQAVAACWVVYKDVVVAEEAAKSRMREDIGTFNHDFLRPFIDHDKLVDHYYPYGDHDSWDEDEWLDQLREFGMLKGTKFSRKKIDELREQWLKNHGKSNFDPFDYLEGMVSEDEVIPTILKNAPGVLDVEAAIDQALRHDGKGNYLAIDDREIELEHGAYAYRVD